MARTSAVSIWVTRRRSSWSFARCWTSVASRSSVACARHSSVRICCCSWCAVASTSPVRCLIEECAWAGDWAWRCRWRGVGLSHWMESAAAVGACVWTGMAVRARWECECECGGAAEGETVAAVALDGKRMSNFVEVRTWLPLRRERVQDWGRALADLAPGAGSQNYICGGGH